MARTRIKDHKAGVNEKVLSLVLSLNLAVSEEKTTNKVLVLAEKEVEVVQTIALQYNKLFQTIFIFIVERVKRITIE